MSYFPNSSKMKPVENEIEIGDQHFILHNSRTMRNQSENRLLNKAKHRLNRAVVMQREIPTEKIKRNSWQLLKRIKLLRSEEKIRELSYRSSRSSPTKDCVTSPKEASRYFWVSMVTDANPNLPRDLTI